MFMAIGIRSNYFMKQVKTVYGFWRNGESLLMDIELHFGVMKAFRNYLGVTVVKRYKNTKDH